MGRVYNEIGAANAEVQPSVEHSESKSVGLFDLFRIFLFAGLTFGGGLAIITVLEKELVRDRRAIARDEFLTYYALARVVPTGTQTALAIALGRHFAGLKGALVAMAGLLTPVFVATLGLTIALTAAQATPAVEILPRTVLPAAVALIAVGAISLSRDLVGVKRETALALAAFLVAWQLRISPGIILLAGGFIGILLFRHEGKEKKL